MGAKHDFFTIKDIQNSSGASIINKNGEVVVDVVDNAISTTSFNSRASATLAAAGTFQGVGEEVTKYGRVGVSIRSSNSTAASDGTGGATLTMEVSHDNITWGGPTRTWKDTQFATPKTWNIIEPYFRIKVVMGSVEASDCVITTQYSNNADIVLGHQLDEILPAGTEAQVVRPGNSFDLDTARIHIMGQRAFFFFGFNEVLGSGTWEDIHPTGGNIQWLQEAVTLEVSSSSSADDSSGAGVQSIEVHGLSDTGVDQDEVIAMGGTSTTESALTYRRVNKVHNEDVGTYGGSHQGLISVVARGSATTLSAMTGREGLQGASPQYGSGEAGNGYWSVPLGKVMYITRLNVIPNVKANQTVDIILYEREGLLDTTTPFSPRRIIWDAIEINEPVEKVFKSHIKIKALTDLFFRAVASSTGSKISVALDFYLVDADSNGA